MQRKENVVEKFLYDVDLVVEYSTATNTHPEGVRLAVLKTAPEEEFGGYRRICANVLAG